MKYEETRQNKAFDKRTSSQKPKQPNDSSENVAQSGSVDFRFSGVRKHTSIRCDSNLWKEFKSVCKSNGFSTCNELEKLILGFLVGVREMCHKPTTIDVVVDAPRVVKRVRRRQLVFENEVDVVEGDVCVYCGREAVGVFRYRRTGKEYSLCGFHAKEFLAGKTWEVVS
jgi:hypothetical protein